MSSSPRTRAGPGVRSSSGDVAEVSGAAFPSSCCEFDGNGRSEELHGPGSAGRRRGLRASRCPASESHPPSSPPVAGKRPILYWHDRMAPNERYSAHEAGAHLADLPGRGSPRRLAGRAPRGARGALGSSERSPAEESERFGALRWDARLLAEREVPLLLHRARRARSQTTKGQLAPLVTRDCMIAP